MIAEESAEIDVIRDIQGNPVTAKVDGKYLDRFELLRAAERFALRYNEKRAWETMSLASQLFHPQDDWVFVELYGEVTKRITRMALDREAT